MNDSELFLIDAQFWFDGSRCAESINWARIEELQSEYGLILKGSRIEWDVRSWFALLLSEVLK